MRFWKVGVLIVLVVGAAAVALAIDADEPEVRPGSFLREPRWARMSLAMAPGREIVDTMFDIENDSNRPVILKTIEEVPNTDMAQVRYYIAQGDAVRSTYHSFPPVVRIGGKRRTATLVPVEGFVLQPGEAAIVAMRIKALQEGAIAIRERRVTYEVDGERYWEEHPLEFTSRVKTDSPRHLSHDERTCEDVHLLPKGS